jgi:hypothetical protein
MNNNRESLIPETGNSSVTELCYNYIVWTVFLW